MSIVKEFREFAVKGNVVDMAVGIIIGAAFGKIVSSLVADILMPPIGKMMGGVNFSSLFIALDGKEYPSLEVAKAAGAPTINYGNFTQTVIDFVIIAFAVFMIVKAMNARKKEVPAGPPPPPPAQEVLLTEIRDLLRRSAPR